MQTHSAMTEMKEQHILWDKCVLNGFLNSLVELDARKEAASENQVRMSKNVDVRVHADIRET